MIEARPCTGIILAVLLGGSSPVAAAGSEADRSYCQFLRDFKSGLALRVAKSNNVAIEIVGARLRKLYTESNFYRPYTDPTRARVEEARRLLKSGRFKECFHAARSAANENITNLGALKLAGACGAAHGAPQELRRYAEYYHLQIASVLREAGRDGRSANTSYRVISIADEYDLLDHFGVTRTSQSLVYDAAGEPVDCLKLAAPDKEGRFNLCFNVAKPLAKLKDDIARKDESRSDCTAVLGKTMGTNPHAARPHLSDDPPR